MILDNNHCYGRIAKAVVSEVPARDLAVAFSFRKIKERIAMESSAWVKTLERTGKVRSFGEKNSVDFTDSVICLSRICLL